MISRSRSKLIRSLHQKKFREAHGLFLAEGEKVVEEFLLAGLREAEGNPVALPVQEVFATPAWLESNQEFVKACRQVDFSEAMQEEIDRVSTLVTPRPVLALIETRKSQAADLDASALLSEAGGPVLLLESLRDPGNLGTIIRTADWFGITDIICSPDSTDIYNPKVVQSTMGAILRVRIHYHGLAQVISLAREAGRQVLGTFLNGEDLYNTELPGDPLLLFGNESRGISPELETLVSRRLTIPSFAGGAGSESLNVASSVAVFCSEFRRRS